MAGAAGGGRGSLPVALRTDAAELPAHGDLRTVQEPLGHADRRMTAHHAHVVDMAHRNPALFAGSVILSMDNETRAMSSSITLPPTLLGDVQRLAEREGKTVEELLQEAVRRYLTHSRVRELQRYGQQQSEKLGLTESDVERVIDEYRREKREQPSG